MERQKQILLQIDSLSSGGAAAQSTSGDQSGAAASMTPTADAGTANAGAPVKSGDANTDYNAAIALVQDKSRQDDAMVAFQNFIKNYPDSTYLPNAQLLAGSVKLQQG
ncbi:putative tetratricopeptide repeat exported protein [Escherichia coli]|uniref:Putative tetratricopeptide repeat exported protein n=1 Tax=Escherichia coli TaxID=562 RepID=A0A376VMS0_ECOLX|nr:putative tetratricopeptide repeat exported protein [Escherichia coli]